MDPASDTPKDDPRPLLRRALLALRLSIAGWIFFWGVAALDGVTRGRILFAQLPHTQFSDGEGIFIATLEIALAGLVGLGLLRGPAYVGAFFLQALASFAVYPAFFAPFAGPNILLAANGPLLVAHGVLFTLRKEDTLLAADSLLMRLRAHLTSSQSSTTNASRPVV